MFNEDKFEQDIENWFVDVGGGLKEVGVSYFSILFKGIKEVASIGYMGKIDVRKIITRIVIYTFIVALLILKTEEITMIYSEFLSDKLNGVFTKVLYKPVVTKVIAVLIGLNCFYGIGVSKKLEEEEMSSLFEEIKFFTGKKITVIEGDKKVMVPETPRLIRKITKDSETRLFMFQSKGILPEEWEKRKNHLEYILEGKIINLKRGNKKSMKLLVVTEEKFDRMTEFYRRMEAFDENFERMNLVGKGSREVEVFGEIKKTKNFPQFIKETEETINEKVVATTTFKSSGLTLSDFKVKKYEYENVMNRLIVEMSQDKINKQLYFIKTIDTKDELKELYEWSDRFIDERDGVLILGEGRLSKVALDLNITPHILLGGVTGSGKSVEMICLIYQGILKGWYPILIDFKGGLELGIFNEFSETGVLFEIESVLKVLLKLTKEHYARLEEFKKYPGVKNIVDYNKKVYKELQLARIILGIDEIAELLDTTGKSKAEVSKILSVESELNTLARLSRSTGINILTGTQRPDSNVLKGQIKNNLGARICGRMTDKEPSIMVLGSPDATKLPEDAKGRYMFSTGADPVIMQGYFFKESDVKKGSYLKGRLLTMSTPSKLGEKNSSEKEVQVKNAEPYEDFHKEGKSKAILKEIEDGVSEEFKETLNEETNEKPRTAEENHQDVMNEFMGIIESSEKITLRALRSVGIGQDTILEILLDVYEAKEIDDEKLDQIKLILFKEGKLSNAEYSKKSNAEPFI